eukprot:7848069-Pyramimonas_sp.AAC.1
MGSEDSEVSGLVGPRDQIDFNGLELQKLAQQYDMRITNTFIPHDRPGTFRAKCGTLHRLDYILLQRSIHDCATSSFVMSDMVLLEDHQTIGHWWPLLLRPSTMSHLNLGGRGWTTQRSRSSTQ